MSEAVPSPSYTSTEMGLPALLPGSVVLVNSPPDYVKQISNHLASSVEQQSGHEDSDSDSGNSFFITQMCAPERRRRSRPDFRTHRDASEQEYDTSSSDGERGEDRKQKNKNYRLPKFTFPFLKKGLRLPYHQNRKLQYYAMGGYFRCAEQLWESYQTGESLLASLPTVDVDGDPITPLSEPEDETIEDEDIRVVEKKLFVASIAKSSQPWYNPEKRSGEEMQQHQEHTNTTYESERGQVTAAPKKSLWTCLSKGLSSSKAKESDEISEEAESFDKSEPNSGNLTAEIESTDGSSKCKSRESGFIPRENRNMHGMNSNAAGHEVSAEGCDSEATEPHAGADEESCNNDVECRRIKAKKGMKKKMDRGDDNYVEGGKDQSLEVAKGQRADPSVTLIITEVEEAPCMKKKKHRNKDLGKGPDGQLHEGMNEDSVVKLCKAEVGERTKKKERDVDANSIKTSKPAESETKDGDVPKKRKKAKKDCSDLHQTPAEHPEMMDRFENVETSQEKSLWTCMSKGSSSSKAKESDIISNSVERGEDQNIEVAKGQRADPCVTLFITEVEEAPFLKKKKHRNKALRKGPDGQLHEEMKGDSVVKLCEAEVGERTKKKEKGVDANSVKISKPAESETNNGDVPKKRKRTKKDCSDLHQTPAEHPEMMDRFENVGTSLEKSLWTCMSKGSSFSKAKESDKISNCVERGEDQSLEVAKGQRADPCVSLFITEVEEAPCMKKKKHRNKDLVKGADRQSHEGMKEDSVVRCEAEVGERRKKKERNVDTNSLKTSKPAESETKDGDVPKKRKKARKDSSDLHQTPAEHPETMGRSENDETSQEKSLWTRVSKGSSSSKAKESDKISNCVERGEDQSLEVAKGQRADPCVTLFITEVEEAPRMKKKKHRNKDLVKGADRQSHGGMKEDSVVRCEAEVGERRKKKERNVDTNSLKTSKPAESETKDGDVPKKRKKARKDSSDLHQTPAEHPETLDRFENVGTSQETLESSGFKRKKHKKKKNRSPSDYQTDVDFSYEAITVAEESVENTQQEKQDAELDTRKKKKKKKKVKDDTSINYLKDRLTSSDCSELVSKKKKRRSPSFLSADVEDQCTPVQSASAREGRAETPEVSVGELAAESANVSEHLQESKAGKKKKKRSAAVPQSEDREPEETSEAAGGKKKKLKRTESLTGSLESVADAGCSQTEEVVVVKKKKKKKKKKKHAEEVPPAAMEPAEAQKSAPNHGRGAESTLSTEQQAMGTLTECASDLYRSGGVLQKKKRKSVDITVPEGKSCTRTADRKTHKTKKIVTNMYTSPKPFPTQLETSSHCVKGKGVHAKRKLYNPDENFLSDLGS